MSGPLVLQSFEPPTVDVGAVGPIAVVLVAAVVGVLVDAFAPYQRRAVLQQVLTTIALVVAGGLLIARAGTPTVAFSGSLAMDGPAIAISLLVVVVALLALPLYAESRIDPAGDPFVPAASTIPGSEAERVLTQQRVRQTEVYPLTLFAVGGMMLMAASADLLTMFIALEVLSLPLYILAGLSRRKRLLSQEAAMKYFLLGAFASAFFLYGAALVYGGSGSVRLVDIDAAVSARVGADGLLLVGLGLLSLGLLFKVGAAPFHVWTPDVYQGAPTPVTAFMAAATKAAAFVALLRVLYVAFGGLADTWVPVMSAVAIVSMVLGSVLALTQTEVKRMLAYSSIAHAGFLLVGLVAADTLGLAAVLVYLVLYAVTTVGAFAVTTLVRDAGGEAGHLSQWAGIGRRAPWVAGAFALFLLAFAGIPLTSGFIGKLSVFAAALDAGAVALVVVGLVTSAVAAFFYVRVIVVMFFTDGGTSSATVAVPSAGTTLTIGITAILTVVLGVLPGPVLDLAERAAEFLA